jgi:Transposase Tn5 dimerisation domain
LPRGGDAKAEPGCRKRRNRVPDWSEIRCRFPPKSPAAFERNQVPVCSDFCKPEQWKALVVFHTRKPPPAQPPSLCQMILLIAQLGGFLARKSDAQPGPQTLWRGLQRLDDITAAFRSYAIAYPLPP